jgi:HK97 gp10 family phage protein
MPTMRVDGLTEGKDSADALPQAFRDVVSETLDEGGDIIFNEAYRRVPIRKGTLKKSLGKNVRDDGLEVAVGSGDPIARFVEFATNDTPAQPFLFPGFRIGARYIRRLMREWADDVGQRARFKTKRYRKPKKVAA